MNTTIALPADLLSQPYAGPLGWFHGTDYGWRFFPGSVGLRKTLAAVRASGFVATRMACGTYRCVAGA